MTPADPARLERHVRALEGPRHPVTAPEALERAEVYVAGELAGFNLEEPQGPGWEHRVGSRRFAAEARREGRRYRGCLVFEMVGYTDPKPGSQTAPWLLFWKDVPGAGTFLAAVGSWSSKRLLGTFREAAAAAATVLRLAGRADADRGCR